MKRHLYLVWLVAWLLVISSCTQSDQGGKAGRVGSSDPTQLGQQVFGLLGTIDAQKFDEFKKGYITADEIHSLATNETLVPYEDYRKRLSGMTQENLDRDRRSDFDGLRSAGASEGINWKSIEYLDHIYRHTDITGNHAGNDKASTMLEGHLYFKSGEKTFLIKTTFANTGSEYRLHYLGELEESVD